MNKIMDIIQIMSLAKNSENISLKLQKIFKQISMIMNSHKLKIKLKRKR